MGLSRKGEPDPVAREVAEQHNRSQQVLERVERIMRNAATTLRVEHDAAAVDAYTKAENERTGR